jgi:hypothetical protein
MIRKGKPVPRVRCFKDCAFWQVGYCVLDDGECGAVCRDAMREYTDLKMRDYLDLLWRRYARRQDLFIKWLAVGVSVLALIVSVASLSHSCRSNAGAATSAPSPTLAATVSWREPNLMPALHKEASIAVSHYPVPDKGASHGTRD